MYRILIASILLPLPIYGQWQLFEPENMVTTSLELASDIYCADLDGDGDLDIVASAEIPSVLLMFENFGNNIYSEPVLLDRTEHDISDVYLDDLNEDGLPDVIYAGQRLRFRLNLGNNQFSAATTLDYDYFNKLNAADIDGDGDKDIVAISTSADLVKWYPNDGFGNFGTANSIAQFSSFGDPSWFVIKDIDNDGDLDVFSALSGDDQIVMSLNNGSGVFGLAQIIVASLNGANAVDLADFDGDNDLDVVATSSQNNQIVWSENLGSLTFGTTQIISSISSPQCIVTGDMDGDGDIDIVSGSLSIGAPILFTNLSGGTFSAGQSIGVENLGMKNIVAFDMDNDSNLEVLIASSFHRSFSLYDNLGGAVFGPREIISEPPTTLTEMVLSDLDQDGYIDIVSGSTVGKLCWNRNRGNTGFGPKQVISTSMNNPRSIVPADIDNDGDPDLVIASDTDDKVMWFENLGGGIFNQGTIISQFTNGPVDVAVGDLDGDGDLDILNASQNDNDLYWYENVGGSFSIEQFIQSNVGNTPILIDTADIDNDGDLDVITLEGAYIKWRENGNNWASQWVAVVTSGKSFSAGDIDLDGDIDVAYAKGGGGGGYGIGWAENNGSGVFASHPIETTINYNSIELVDVDHDLDLDMLFTFLSNSYPVYWRENYGNGIFGPAKQIASEFEGGATKTRTADLDNDGDMDVVSCEGARDKLAYFPNKFYSLFQARGSFYIDANNNGIRDTLEPNFGTPNIASLPNNLWSIANTEGLYLVTFDSTIQTTYNVFPTNHQYWGISSSFASYNVNVNPIFTFIDSLDFGFYPDTLIDSIVVDIIAGFPRCNSEVNLWLTSTNEGTTRPSGIYILEMDTLTTFVNSSILPDSIVGNLVYWHYDSLMYFTSDQINPKISYPDFQYSGYYIDHVFTNKVLDSIGNTVYVQSDSISHVLVCAYDPNDKVAEPIGVGIEGYISQQTEFIDYTIRFQNTGTDTAFLVIITDQLDPSLDWSSFDLISNSHSVSIEADSTGFVIFEFAPILLPDSSTNFIGSQGFVKYRVYLNSGLSNGTVINNTANIYFDYNPAIVTNTKINTLYDCSSPFNEFPEIIEVCQNNTVEYSANLPDVLFDWEIPNIANGVGNSVQWLADSVGQFIMNVHVENQVCAYDSTFEVNVLPNAYASIDTIEICEGESFEIFGLYQSTAGTYYDTLIASNGCDSIQSIVLMIDPCAGIENVLFLNKIVIFPNPARSILNVESSLKIRNYSIYTVTGKEVNVELIGVDSFYLHLNISELSIGVYIMEIEDELGNIHKQRFIKEF